MFYAELDVYARLMSPNRRPWETIFCNRSLRLDHIDVVGFDMDYTLAVYRQSEMNRLSVDETLGNLAKRGYPTQRFAADFPLDFPIRGLLIDKERGNVLKMDRHRYVKRAYSGRRELNREERRVAYHTSRLQPSKSRYHWVDTLYALSEVTVFSAAVETLTAASNSGSANFSQLFTDIRASIDQAHQDGTILDSVRADPARYLRRDPDLFGSLDRLRLAGKKLFLLTNSPADYTDAVMSYLFDESTNPHGKWLDAFDYVIASAAKPRFFTGKAPFRDTATLTNTDPTELQRGQIYEGGNITALEATLGIGGDRVLYVGDHIYGDVLRAKKDSAWRTVMIIQEMEEEIQAMGRCRNDHNLLDALEERRDGLYDRLRELQHFSRSSQAEEADQLRGELESIEDEHADIEARVDAAFHPYWGSIFKAGAELSSFGDQVEQYACLYTTRVSHFLRYSPMHYFRSPRAHMPHEVALR